MKRLCCGSRRWQVVKLDPRKDATHFLSLVHVQEGKLDLTGCVDEREEGRGVV